MATPTEHVVVGIDIGETYTGVAIFPTDLDKPLSGKIEPRVIQIWPRIEGKPGQTIVNKVPTRITYMASSLRPHFWGFECPKREDLEWGMKEQSLFKFLLDKENLDTLNRAKIEQGAPATQQQKMEDVHMWYTHFLSNLYGHIVQHLTHPPTLNPPPWNVVLGTTTIEYIFSLPTSWENKTDLIADFEAIIKNAGFGDTLNSSAKVGLTEGIASAVYTVRNVNHEFKTGEIFLLCDAGGRTSDICSLRVSEIDRTTVGLETVLESISIFGGSVEIDEGFELLFQKGLEDLQKEKPELFENYIVSEYVAHDVAQGDFQNLKTTWEDTETNVLRFVALTIPGRFKNLVGDGRRRYVRIPRSDINELFDRQVKKITSELDERLSCLYNIYPSLKISGLILTGGLGSSKYLQSRIATHFKPHEIKILIDARKDEPPVSVCKGLVYDRVQRILHGTSVLRLCQARASYGLLYNGVYNKTIHKERKPITDQADGRKYMPNQIDWFLKKGQKIEEDSLITRDRSRRSIIENPDPTWTDQIVTSNYASNCLPTYLGQGDCRVVGTVVSNANPNTLLTRRTRPLGRKFLQGDYKIKIYFEDHALRVETEGADGIAGRLQVPDVRWEFKKETLAPVE
ncbi:hypothetical protein BGZ60DRAFT_535278 [Tricladium varicosporioides]|nr:hypothetical protein BGZ60DRAFT_535278 [Hymenoscyphus varicosporioides]